MRCVVFDMDGLMVDSEPLSRQAWQEVLAQHGQVLDAALYARMIGHRTDESARMVLASVDLPLTPAQLVAQKNARLADIRGAGVPPMPGLFTLVEALARRGVPWGVATSSPRAHAGAILAQLGLAAACRAVAAGDEVPLGKPAPDIYLLAAARLGVPAATCLALEDSAPGCRAAQAAGMRVVAVPNGQTHAADFGFVPDVMASLAEVAARLDELLPRALGGISASER